MITQYIHQTPVLSLEKPLTEIVNLNIKTIQKINYLTPAEILNYQDPELALEENVAYFLKNGHKTLDYMDKVFLIMEDYWFNISDNLEEFEV